MKEIKKENTEVKITYEYEAIDGTIFKSKEECQKYEESAKGVLMSRYMNLVLSECVEYDLFDCGSEENIVEIIKVETEKDVDTIKQLLYINHPYYQDKPTPDWMVEDFQDIEEAHKNKDVLFVGRGYEKDCFFMYGTSTSLSKKFLKYKLLKQKKDVKE